jgi:hypothetical protein
MLQMKQDSETIQELEGIIRQQQKYYVSDKKMQNQMSLAERGS